MDSVSEEDGMHHVYPAEFLQQLNAGRLPPALLCLKVGSPVILLRNLNPGEGLCNGTRMVVLNVRRKILQCRIISKDRRFKGKVVLIPRIRLSPNAETLPVNGVYSVKFHIAFYYLLQLHIYISLLYLKSSACCSYILVIPLAMHMLQIAPPPGRY